MPDLFNMNFVTGMLLAKDLEQRDQFLAGLAAGQAPEGNMLGAIALKPILDKTVEAQAARASAEAARASAETARQAAEADKATAEAAKTDAEGKLKDANAQIEAMKGQLDLEITVQRFDGQGSLICALAFGRAAKLEVAGGEGSRIHATVVPPDHIQLTIPNAANLQAKFDVTADNILRAITVRTVDPPAPSFE